MHTNQTPVHKLKTLQNKCKTFALLKQIIKPFGIIFLIHKIFFTEKAKKDFWIIKKALLLQSVWSSSLRNLIY